MTEECGTGDGCSHAETRRVAAEKVAHAVRTSDTVCICEVKQERVKDEHEQNKSQKAVRLLDPGLV